MGFINEWLSNQPIAVMVISSVVAFNLSLAGLSKGLDFIKDKTKTDLDNKALVVVNKISSLLQKVIDALGYNPKH